MPSRRSRAERPAFAVGFGAAAFTHFASEGWWARQDSNLQPDRYERPALTIELQAPPRSGRKEAAGNGAGIVYRHDSDTAMPGLGAQNGLSSGPVLAYNLSRVIRPRNA